MNMRSAWNAHVQTSISSMHAKQARRCRSSNSEQVSVQNTMVQWFRLVWFQKTQVQYMLQIHQEFFFIGNPPSFLNYKLTFTSILSYQLCNIVKSSQVNCKTNKSDAVKAVWLWNYVMVQDDKINRKKTKTAGKTWENMTHRFSKESFTSWFT